MNTYHKALLKEIQKAPKRSNTHPHNNSYHGTNHHFYHLSTPVKQDIAKTFKKEHAHLSFDELIELLDSLNAGDSYEEKTIAATLLYLYSTHKKQIAPHDIERWLTNLEGWAEIDSLCQSMFGAEELLAQWDLWEKALTSFSQSPLISHRRASLVLLVRPVRTLYDVRLKSIAFENIERLKGEKDILITKAISWLLRGLIRYYREDVISYLTKESGSLPAIAVRETRRKLETGKK